MSKKELEGQLSLFDYEEKRENTIQPQKFEECMNCWCYDCKYNQYNEGVPRDLCGNKIPCPACDECVRQGYADICEIGSAKKGCSLRAKEEGLMLES